MEEAQILEILSRIQRDSGWVSETYDELRKKCEKKVFTVKGGKVIHEAEKVGDLVRDLEKRGGNAAFLLIESIPPRDTSFIL